MKKIIAIALAIIMVVFMAACEPAYEVDTNNGTGRGQIGPIEDYHIEKNAWLEGNTITTPQGHCWHVENPTGYVGRFEVSYDGRGTSDVRDDILVIALPPEN